MDSCCIFIGIRMKWAWSLTEQRFIIKWWFSYIDFILLWKLLRQAFGNHKFLVFLLYIFLWSSQITANWWLIRGFDKIGFCGYLCNFWKLRCIMNCSCIDSLLLKLLILKLWQFDGWRFISFEAIHRSCSDCISISRII